MAVLTTICQSCRLVALDPFVYLQDVFKAMHAGRTDYANLRPKAWASQGREKKAG